MWHGYCRIKCENVIDEEIEMLPAVQSLLNKTFSKPQDETIVTKSIDGKELIVEITLDNVPTISDVPFPCSEFVVFAGAAECIAYISENSSNWQEVTPE